MHGKGPTHSLYCCSGPGKIQLLDSTSKACLEDLSSAFFAYCISPDVILWYCGLYSLCAPANCTHVFLFKGYSHCKGQMSLCIFFSLLEPLGPSTGHLSWDLLNSLVWVYSKGLPLLDISDYFFCPFSCFLKFLSFGPVLSMKAVDGYSNLTPALAEVLNH